VATLRARAATSVHVTGDGIRATLPPGSTGTAVVAAPRIAGWHCEGAAPVAYGGLLAVPAGSTLSCSFRPPGLRAGLAAGAVAALGLLGVAVAGRRGVRTGRSPR
ncbi:YfhO family protein, partial [Streptomyces tanashiensis]